jgi:TrmH family RNA methyltransferase
MHRVSSRRNPIVARYRAAAGGETPGVLLLDGVHLVREALDAGVHFHHVTFAAEALDTPEVHGLADRLAPLGVELAAATPAAMAAISPVRSPSAAVALAAKPSPAPRTGMRALIVVAADVQDPGNLGAIVRVAEAGGATAVVAAGAGADPFGWKALRGAMGSALRLPVERVGSLDGAVAAARDRGCRIVATVPRGGTPLGDCDLRGPVAVLLGGEGPGLPPAAVAAADVRLTIPMEPPVESLNAAVAAALVVYEARRQRLG